MRKPLYSLNAKGHFIDLSSPKIMGILNITPDSFYDGGRYQYEQAIVGQAKKMWEEGAAILDIGGYSSRPGAAEVSESEETERVCKAIEHIGRALPTAVISVDTFRSKVAKAAIAAGAHIINDISGGQLDDDMLATAGQLQVPYIMMHMRGNPQNMASLTDYDNLLGDILDFFHQRIAQARALGIKDIVIDPGFGFAKTLDQNYKLLHMLAQLYMLQCPMLVGISRKSMIYKLLETSPQEALNGTSILNTMALERGAQILRVHDVKPAKEVVSLYEKLYEAKKY